MQDTDELVIASHGDVYVAPVGTPLPTSPTSNLNAAFRNTGLINEDGASLTVSPEIQVFNSWQRRRPVRREMTAQDAAVAFVLQQWNTVNVPLAFGGGAISEPTPGVFRYDPPADDASLEQRAMVLDWQDGDRNYRFVVPVGSVGESVETTLQRAALSELPVTFNVDDQPWYLLTDDPAFAAGS